MATNDKNIELIIHLLREQDEKRNIQIKGLHKNMEGSFEAFNIKLDRLEDEIQAIARIDQRQQGDIKMLKKETSIWRWIQKNPKKSLLIIFAVFVSILGLLSYLTKEEVETVIKKIIGL